MIKKGYKVTNARATRGADKELSKLKKEMKYKH
jgi:hypothetical protein